MESREGEMAMLVVLGRLRLPELLSSMAVCKAWRDAIAEDVVAWRDLSVEPPLSRKLTDEVLMSVTSRAQGKLRCLCLLDCRRITGDGLQSVVHANPHITKLYLPGCSNITADGVVTMVRSLTLLKKLKLNGIANIRKHHLDTLNTLIKTQQEIHKPVFSYKQWRFRQLQDHDCPIDVGVCSQCDNPRLVFDCTSEDCRLMKNRISECRGCTFCIPRCEECGRCTSNLDDHYGEGMVCLDGVCLQCWLGLPKCNSCNRAYCSWHMKLFLSSNSPTPSSSTDIGFVCESCLEDFQAQA